MPDTLFGKKLSAIRGHLRIPRVNTAEIEGRWREYLCAFADSRIESELQSRWGADPNVVQGRIQLAYPPAFQPGYIGTHYVSSQSRILFIGYNPGEGKQKSSQDEDKELTKQLNAFAEGQLTFAQLNLFLGSHLLKWAIYSEKGIFSETGNTRIALLPADLRPSVQSVALLNLFPLKKVSNKKPLAGYGGNSTSLKVHMWELFVRPTIETLAPSIIVRYPESDPYLQELEELKSKPRIVRVWHPSDYNLSAQRQKLEKSWLLLAAEISLSQSPGQNAVKLT